MITSQKLSKIRDEIVALTQLYETMISFKSNSTMKFKNEHKFDAELSLLSALEMKVPCEHDIVTIDYSRITWKVFEYF